LSLTNPDNLVDESEGKIMPVRFLTGKDYPHLCPKCQAAIDDVARLYKEGLMEDTDDEEAPCLYVYDHALFCGGRECRNPPQD
jgi:hypothetical protein